MPPSTIPQAQVQAMIAELRDGPVHPDVPKEYAEPAHSGGRRFGAAAIGFLLAGAVLGAAVGFLGPSLGLFGRNRAGVSDTPPLALSVSRPTPVATPAPAPDVPVAATPPPAAKAEVVAPARPAPPAPVAAPQPAVKARAATPARIPPPHAIALRSTKGDAPAPRAPAKSRACLAGGACSRTDVAAAEGRLERAYSAAERSGASPARLASVRQRWNALKAHAADRPRTTIGGYRRLASELTAPPKRRKHASSAAIIPYRRAR